MTELRPKDLHARLGQRPHRRGCRLCRDYVNMLTRQWDKDAAEGADAA